MTEPIPVPWAPQLVLLSDVGAARWVESALLPFGRADSPVASMVPEVFDDYVRVLPPTYGDTDGVRHRWSQIAAERGVDLTATTRFDELVDGSTRWGRPGDGVLDVRETAALVDVLTNRTGTPEHAYFCLWDGFNDDEIGPWYARPARVRVPHRGYHLLTGPVTAAIALPDPYPWRCANLWWPADRSWLVATEIDGYLTYVGGSAEAIDALLTANALDVVRVLPSTPLDPSYG